VSLSVLAKDLDEGLTIFFDVLRNPAFREEPLMLAKAASSSSCGRPTTAEHRPQQGIRKLLYGENALTRQPTKATYESVSASDLKAFHAKYFSPRNIICGFPVTSPRPRLKTRSISSPRGGRAAP